VLGVERSKNQGQENYIFMLTKCNLGGGSRLSLFGQQNINILKFVEVWKIIFCILI